MLQKIILLVAASLLALTATGCTSSLPDDTSSAERPAAEAEQIQSGPETLKPAPEEAASAVPEPDLQAIADEFAGRRPEEWGLDVTGVHSRHGGEGVALTLDACGGPGGSDVDWELLTGLRERNVPATLFVNSRWVEANRELAEDLAADPLFELENHGTAHLPLSVNGQSAYEIPGTNSPREVVDEIWENHVLLTEITGQAPRYFRSGTAHYDELAVQIAGALGYRVIGFDVNADAGATFTAAQVQAALSEADPGSIVIAHFNQPGGQTAAGILAAIDQMATEGIQFVPLDDPV